MKKRTIVILSICAVIIVLAVASIFLFKYFNLGVENKVNGENDLNSVGNEIESEIPKVDEITEEEKYHALARKKISEMSLDEKIGQLFLSRFPTNEDAVNIARDNYLGGYVLFEVDFRDKSFEEVQKMINDVQNAVKIPLIMSVDEEGGIVVRVSSNSNLSDEKFKSSSELYNEGGMERIKQDTIKKSEVLSNVGVNLNLAPVVDVSTDPNDYMYERTIKQNVDIVSEFAKTVIETSKNTDVSYTLKHFPGYGNNVDTHKTGSLDTRSYDEIINNAIPPFRAGIEAGAEAILISHNIIQCMDGENPASISNAVHNLLRDELGFNGMIITDDVSMGAVSEVENVYVKAINAGNNLIITSDYVSGINEVKEALNNGSITEEKIDELIEKTIYWKYYKKMLK